MLGGLFLSGADSTKSSGNTQISMCGKKVVNLYLCDRSKVSSQPVKQFSYGKPENPVIFM